MTDDRLSFSLQLVTAIAVLIGIGLVVLELRQTRELVRSQFIGETHSIWINRSLHLAGEDAYKVLAKACSEEQLDLEEMIRFNEVMNSYVHGAMRLWQIYRVTEFSDVYLTGAAGQLGEVFSYPLGNAWWSIYREFYPGEFVAFADQVAAGFPREANCGDVYERLEASGT